ncbi:DUF4180 domain-containing protein [Cytophagaceae bacterium DM2B3-1]|uniref:DUF4180 domain-containing protein n=1 Tax=Xanthocytophaga flava TaxID=3048013 RepID=A0ABT7CTR9_9BACT|nr:DUF4180 domain-containing protein [Xanthocytophaga flavus]MDJ1471854.1 DUF4180 domain-containing protein [Xanthocytophaga flavus]MDJ1497123.1 DUF4180 domain-containing protein [Xanthocytophaga flavus]
MNIKIHQTNGTSIAEAISEALIITNLQDALDLIGNCSYQGADKIIVYEQNITPDFFDLKTKLAGEVLQKFSNYRMQLAIVGDFSQYSSHSLQSFIYESNKGSLVKFVSTLEEALS